MMRILVACREGLLRAEATANGWSLSDAMVSGQRLRTVASRGGILVVGTTTGAYRSLDDGASWHDISHGLHEWHIRRVDHHSCNGKFFFAGTEPAGLYRLEPGETSWTACLEVAELRDELQWRMPYSPAAGCVRGFAFHGERAYAAVEVGGLLRSDDGGKTWALAEGSSGRPDDEPVDGRLHPDVHSVVVHESSCDHVVAATGGGLFRSTDGGTRWSCLYECYCRSAWIDPRDADRIIFGPADGVESMGRIEQSLDGGKTWQSAWSGLSAPWKDSMVERFVQIDQRLFAVLSNGHLLVADRGEPAWTRVLSRVEGITDLAASA